jgi:O-antigen/teichoic acid export membrane protein
MATLFERTRIRLQQLPARISGLGNRAVKSGFAYGAVAQLLNSAGTFLFTAFLVRYLSPESFGVFSISFAIVFFLGGVTAALVTMQMAVHVKGYPVEQQALFIEKMLMRHHRTVLLEGFVIGTALLGYNFFWHGFADSFLLSFSVYAAAFSFSYRDFIVRVCYERSMERYFLRFSISIISLFVAMLVVVFLFKWSLKPWNALLIYALSNFIPPFVLRNKIGVSFVNFRKHSLTLPRLASAFYGVNAFFLSIVRQQCHLYFAGWAYGSAGAAIVGASRIVAVPATVLGPALTQRNVPQLSEASIAGDVERFRRVRKRLAKTMLIVNVVLALAMLALFPIAKVLLFAKYNDIFGYVVLWVLVAMVLGTRAVNEVSLIASRRFTTHSRINFIALCVLIPGLFVCSHFFGLKGTIVALLLSEVTVLIQGKMALRGT